MNSSVFDSMYDYYVGDGEDPEGDEGAFGIPDFDATDTVDRAGGGSSYLQNFQVPTINQTVSDIEPEMPNRFARDPKFVNWRDVRRHSQQTPQSRQEQQVDDVRCMFNLAGTSSVPRPVMQQDGGLMESSVAPRTADQLQLDLQQLGLVRSKGGQGKGDVGHDGRADQEPILKDLKLMQENAIERPVFHCFLRDLCIDRRMGTYLVTVEQHEEAYVMQAYEEPSEGQTVMSCTELARFPKFPQLTDGFCLSSSGDIVVFTCTLLGCVLLASLSSCAYEAEANAVAASAAAAASASADAEAANMGSGASGGGGGGEVGRRNSSLLSGRREMRDNQSRNSSQSSIEAAGTEQTFNFRSNRPVTVSETHYKLSEPISEHVYDVCIREHSSSAGSGMSKSNMYVTNKSNIAVVSLPGLKLDNFLFEGLKLPWRLRLHRHLLIIAEKWGSIQIADLDKEHRSLCVMDTQDLSCENGLKSIEIVPEHGLLLLTVYPEGNQWAGHYPDDQTSVTGAGSSSVGGRTTAAASQIGPGLGGNPIIGGLGSGIVGAGATNSGEEAGWNCHCFHFNPEATHGNPMLRYAQTLRLNRAPLSCIYSSDTKRLYILCFHPARNNSILMLKKIEVFHEERGRTVKFSAKQLLLPKDEDEYKAAADGVARRPVAQTDAAKTVEMLDLAGSPLVATMKRPLNFGFT